MWSALDHARAALAQLVELALDAAGEHADQRADDEDAAQVTASIESRKAGLPASPPMVPGSSVRMRLIQQQVEEGLRPPGAG